MRITLRAMADKSTLRKREGNTVKFVNCKIENFERIVETKKIVCFGASRVMQNYYEKYTRWFAEWSDRILFFIDNDTEKWNKEYILGSRAYSVYPASKLNDMFDKDIIIVITTSLQYILSICSCLENFSNLDICECFSLALILNQERIDDTAVTPLLHAKTSIINSRTIHTFWFSQDRIPQEYQKCLDSWKRYCPNYEIRIWDSNSYDVTKNEYMYEAFRKENWAFVSDYARLDIVYQYGGIYMDMDVEVLRNLDDLLKLQCFFGIDLWNYIDLGTGFGALKGNSLIKRLLDRYNDLRFCLEDGSLNRIPQPRLLQDTFLAYGYQPKRDSQLINDTAFLSTNLLNVYEGKEFLNPYHFSRKEYLVHWHNAGWWSKEEKDERYKLFYEQRELVEKKFEFCD